MSDILFSTEDAKHHLHGESDGRFVSKEGGEVSSIEKHWQDNDIKTTEAFRTKVMPKIEKKFDELSSKLKIDFNWLRESIEMGDSPEAIIDKLTDEGDEIYDAFTNAGSLNSLLVDKLGTREMDRLGEDDDTDFEDAIGEWLRKKLQDVLSERRGEILSSIPKKKKKDAELSLNTAHTQAKWYNTLLARCLELTGDVDEAVRSADLAFSVQSVPLAIEDAQHHLHGESDGRFVSKARDVSEKAKPQSKEVAVPLPKDKKSKLVINTNIPVDDLNRELKNIHEERGSKSIYLLKGLVDIRNGDFHAWNPQKGGHEHFDVAKALGIPEGKYAKLYLNYDQEYGSAIGHTRGGLDSYVDKELLRSANSKLDRLPFLVSNQESGAMFAHDIFNRRAQGILNRSIEAVKKMNASARIDLEKSLRTADPAELSQALLTFIRKYRVQLADILTTTQLASLLEGARDVAKKIPTIPIFPSAPPPATLEPQKAMELLDTLRVLPVGEREQKIYELPADQQTFVRQGLMAQEQGGFQPPPPPFVPLAPSEGSPERIHYPIIDEAAQSLAAKNVMTRPQFDALDSAARQKAFTVAHVECLDTMTKIRDVMSEVIRDGIDVQTFRERVLATVDEGTFMSDWHMETILRVNVQTAFSDGQMAVLQHPFVRSGFPYASYEAIHDDRVRHNHLALETLGIDGTNIYRINDPVFQMFRPPWDWCDRCSWIPMTVRMAASKGIEEAKRWIETGVEPSPPAFVAMPSFRPPSGFQRSLSGQSLAIEDAQHHLHGESDGRFVKKGDASGESNKTNNSEKSQKFIDSLSKKERKAIEDYSAEGYLELNFQFRSGGKKSEKTKKKIKEISDILDKHEIDEDTVAYRYVTRFEDYEVGDKFRDDAPISTTTNPDFKYTPHGAKTLAGKLIGDVVVTKMEIHIPKGTKGAYIENVSSRPEESELLLAPRQNFQVVGKENGVLKVRVITQEVKKALDDEVREYERLRESNKSLSIQLSCESMCWVNSNRK